MIEKSPADGNNLPPEVAGCVVGQAIGDMMGLPYENLSPRRIAKLARFDRPSLLFGYGCGSDDTEHLGLTADAIQFAGDNVDAFRKRLASSLRRWFLAGPPGIGMATLKSCLKLCLGFPLNHSGVRSAGNGPAMRAAIIGILVPREKIAEFIAASTRLTHTDPRAEIGSLIVAKLASEARQLDPKTGADWIEGTLGEFESKAELEPLIRNMRMAAEALRTGETLADFARRLMGGRGVSGFIAHTVPVAILAYFQFADDYETGIEQVIRCGGDTDTVAAIAGALIGIRVGENGIPERWRTRYLDWPWSYRRLLSRTRPSLFAIPLIFCRNLGFFFVVLVHLFRRLLPPW